MPFEICPRQVRVQSLFRLLLSLEHVAVDPVHILDLVVAEKPLRALDFCYNGDNDRWASDWTSTLLGFDPNETHFTGFFYRVSMRLLWVLFGPTGRSRTQLDLAEFFTNWNRISLCSL